MSLLIHCQSLAKSFGSRPLFRDLSVSIFERDKIGLIGQNGSGKSTLLKILSGIESPDEGSVAARRGLRIGYLSQTSEFEDRPPLDILLRAMERESQIPDHEKKQRAEMWLSKLGFSGEESSASSLSGGWKKRLALAKEMIFDPELLLLDEPTNHLDLEGILWLEKFLMREAPSYLLVSHDRYFLQHATNRIIEIDRAYPKGLFSTTGTYRQFLERKEEFLQGQLQQEKSLATKARRETEWLRSGAKARTTKSQSRIDRAHEILSDLSDVRSRNTQRRAEIDFAASERETRKLLSGKNLRKEAGGKILFKSLDLLLSPGTRIGLMGPNGSGKTTLLRLLAGELQPDQGTIKRADDLKTVYFDQHRNQLSDQISLRDALSPRGDFVSFRGQQVHVNGWCKRFLFSPEHLDIPIGKLSGGERARIAIAHLMLQPADLLLLDEPTNDLDIPTLETLEESLVGFPGAVVLITHDRCMLDRICNSLLALGDPEKTDFYSDYSQWEAAQEKTPAAAVEKQKRQEPAKQKISLSYLEKKELEQIEGKIEQLEAEAARLNQLLASEEIAQDNRKLNEVCTAIGIAESQIEQLYLRWEELEKKKKLSS